MTHFVMEADGASRGNPGHASYGTVIRNANTGEVVAERAAVLGHATNNVAEYSGLVAGLTAIAELEDIELEIMQAYENAQQAVTELQASEIETTEKLSTLAQTRDDLFADIDFEVNSLTNQRTEIANGLPADLIALYDKIRADQGGVGAALIHRGSCQGCHITIDAQEIDQIRNMSADAIARCDQCRRILVRTAESGL